MTEEQLRDLDAAGTIKLSDSTSAVGDYNQALKGFFDPLFSTHDVVKVSSVLNFIEEHKSRLARTNTSNSKINNSRKAVSRQLKATKLIKKLQRWKVKDTISQQELYALINSAHMNQKRNVHFLHRRGAAGYSENVLDSVYRYMVTAGNFASKAKFYAESSAYYAEKFKKDIRDIATSDSQKFLKTYISANYRTSSITAFDNLVNDFLNLAIDKDPIGFGRLLRNHYGRGVYTGLARDAISLQNVLKLGLFRPASLAVQAFQVLNANAKLGGNPLIGMSKYFRIGLRESVGSKYDEKWKELYDYIGINGESVALDTELLGRRPSFTEKKLLFGKSLKDFAEASMVFFNVGDRWARRLQLLAGTSKPQTNLTRLAKWNVKE